MEAPASEPGSSSRGSRVCKSVAPDERDRHGQVVPLGAESQPEPPPKVTRPSRLHGTAIAGMAVSALVGVASMFLFVMVGWPDGTGRYVIAVFFFSTISFIAFASAAVFTAARDTYAVNPRRREPSDPAE